LGQNFILIDSLQNCSFLFLSRKRNTNNNDFKFASIGSLM